MSLWFCNFIVIVSISPSRTFIDIPRSFGPRTTLVVVWYVWARLRHRHYDSSLFDILFHCLPVIKRSLAKSKVLMADLPSPNLECWDCWPLDNGATHHCTSCKFFVMSYFQITFLNLCAWPCKNIKIYPFK